MVTLLLNQLKLKLNLINLLVLLGSFGEESEPVGLEHLLERIYEGPEVGSLQVALEESAFRSRLQFGSRVTFSNLNKIPSCFSQFFTKKFARLNAIAIPAPRRGSPNAERIVVPSTPS